MSAAERIPHIPPPPLPPGLPASAGVGGDATEGATIPNVSVRASAMAINHRATRCVMHFLLSEAGRLPAGDCIQNLAVPYPQGNCSCDTPRGHEPKLY
jgi:hypothetical protein